MEAGPLVRSRLFFVGAEQSFLRRIVFSLLSICDLCRNEFSKNKKIMTTTTLCRLLLAAVGCCSAVAVSARDILPDKLGLRGGVLHARHLLDGHPRGLDDWAVYEFDGSLMEGPAVIFSFQKPSLLD